MTINKGTYSSSSLDGILEALSESYSISVLNIISGYHQLEID